MEICSVLNADMTPYYYAYCKDRNIKLKKKYIGRNNPREKVKNRIEDNYKNDLAQILRDKQNDLESIFQ